MDLARVLRRTLVVPYVLAHHDVERGLGCKDDQHHRVAHILRGYADVAPKRPALDAFLQLHTADATPPPVLPVGGVGSKADSQADWHADRQAGGAGRHPSVPPTVVWTKLPRGSTVLETTGMLERCCKAKLDDTGAVRYLSDTASGTCDLARCTLVLDLCLSYPNASAPAVASLRAVPSETLVFSSLFAFHQMSRGALAREGAHQMIALNETETRERAMAWDIDCEILTYRPELTSRVEKLLTRALANMTGADGGEQRGEERDRRGHADASAATGAEHTGLIGYDAVHLRLGGSFRADTRTPCGPNCTTRWPSAMGLLQWLDTQEPESRPVYIASDMPANALQLAKTALKRRRFFTSSNLMLQAHLQRSLLGYLESSEQGRSSFMTLLLLDVLVMVNAHGFYSNAGFFSTFTLHVHRTRVCKALGEKMRAGGGGVSESPSGGDSTAEQLISATQHIRRVRDSMYKIVNRLV